VIVWKQDEMNVSMDLTIELDILCIHKVKLLGFSLMGKNETKPSDFS